MASYVSRLYKSNYYENITTLTNYLDMTLPAFNNNIFDQTAIEKVAKLSNQNKKDLENKTANENNLPENHIMHSGWIKFCPSCIQQEIHHRKVWQYHPVGICLTHKEELIDTCQSCNNRILLHHFMKGYCHHCNHPFKNTHSKCLDPTSILYFSQKAIIESIEECKKIELSFGTLSANEFCVLADKSFYLLDRITSFIKPRQKIDILTNRKHSKQKNSKFLLAYSNVYWIYQSIDNYNKLLDRFYSTIEHRIRNHHLLEYEELFLGNSYKPLESQYESYWVEQLEDGLVKKDFTVFKKRPQLLDQKKFLSKKELRTVWNLTYEQIEMLLNHDAIETKVIQVNGSKRYLINRYQVEKLLKKKDNYFNQIEATRYLGISVTGLKSLIATNKLKLHTLPYLETKMISRDECDQLLKKVKGKAPNTNKPIVPFHKALIYLPRKKAGINVIIDLIDNERLTPFSEVKEETKLCDLLFELEELTYCINKLKENETLVSKEDAARVLGMCVTTVQRFIDKGLLIPDRIQCYGSKQKRIWFKKDTINNFKNSHINLKQATAEFKISRSTIHKWIEEGKVDNKAMGLNRYYFINKHQLKKVIQNYKSLA